MDAQYITIKTVPLNNNCPECYSREGLQLTFKQRFKETQLYKSLTAETKKELHCDICKTQVFPVEWTDDIERVVDYQQKAFKPKATTFKLKRLAWILIIAIDLIILLLILYAVGIIKI